MVGYPTVNFWKWSRTFLPAGHSNLLTFSVYKILAYLALTKLCNNTNRVTFNVFSRFKVIPSQNKKRTGIKCIWTRKWTCSETLPLLISSSLCTETVATSDSRSLWTSNPIPNVEPWQLSRRCHKITKIQFLRFFLWTLCLHNFVAVSRNLPSFCTRYRYATNCSHSFKNYNCDINTLLYAVCLNMQ